MSIWDDVQSQPRNASETEATVVIEPWYCALVKGQGKVPWDDAAHSGMTKHVAVTVIATTAYSEIRRDFLAFDRGWRQTLASIERLGLKAQDFERARRASIKIAPVIGSDGKPEVYTNKAGETRERTTIEIVAVDDLDGAPTAHAASPAQAAPAAEQPGYEPRDARERIALQWLIQAASTPIYACNGYDNERIGELSQTLYDATQDLRAKSAVSAISDERWRALCRAAIISANPPF